MPKGSGEYLLHTLRIVVLSVSCALLTTRFVRPVILVLNLSSVLFKFLCCFSPCFVENVFVFMAVLQANVS